MLKSCSRSVPNVLGAWRRVIFKGKGSLLRLSEYTITLKCRYVYYVFYLFTSLDYLTSFLCHPRRPSHFACNFLVFLMIIFTVSSSIKLSNANFWSELFLVYVRCMKEYIANNRHSINSLLLFLAFWTLLSGKKKKAVHYDNCKASCWAPGSTEMKKWSLNQAKGWLSLRIKSDQIVHKNNRRTKLLTV